MKVTFLYSPASYLDMPSLGIACLQAYIKQFAQRETHVWDANQDFFYHLFNSHYFSEHFSLAQEKDLLQPLQKKILTAIAENLDERMDVYHHGEHYYNSEKNNEAFQTLRHALHFYNEFETDLEYTATTAHFNVTFKPGKYSFSLSEVLKHVEHGNAYHFDRFIEASHEKISKAMQSDVLAISCAHPHQLLFSLRVSRHLRNHGFKGKIIMGGSFITRARKVLSSNPLLFKFVDALGVFEGEETLNEYLNYVAGTQNLSTVPNLIYLDNEKILTNPVRKIQNIFHLPTPDFSHYQLDKYLTPEPVMPIYASRGCYYDVCSFCNHHENYFGGYRSKKVSTVYEDMKTYQARYGCTKFFFVDEISSPSYQRELAEMVQQDHRTFRWYVHCRVEPKITVEDLEIMSTGGVTLLHVGVESSNTKVLELMKKGYSHQEVIDFLEKLSRVSLTAHLNTIRGFPGENPEDFLQTLEDMYTYAKVGDIVHLYKFTLLEGSALQVQGNPYIKKQTLPLDDLDEHVDFVVQNVPDETPQESEQITFLQYILSRKMVFFAKIFPEDTNWATHLLYVSRYRERGQADMLDQRLNALKVPELDIFSGQAWMNTQFNLSSHLQFADQTAINPKNLRSYQFDEAFLRWLTEHKNQPLEPAKMTSMQLTPDLIKQNLYKLFKMGVLNVCPST